VLFGTPSPHCAVLLRLTPPRHLSLSLCPLRLHGPVEGGRALCRCAHISARLCGGVGGHTRAPLPERAFGGRRMRPPAHTPRCTAPPIRSHCSVCLPPHSVSTLQLRGCIPHPVQALYSKPSTERRQRRWCRRTHARQRLYLVDEADRGCSDRRQGGGDGAGGSRGVADSLNKNGHFARNAVQLAELSTHCMCEQLRAALTVTPP
jgi:hypothetical protein